MRMIVTDAGDDDVAPTTPLHVAACHGLTSFADQLTTLPAAAAAASLMNADRQTPSNLARVRGNDDTADVIDRLTNQRAASGSTSEYSLSAYVVSAVLWRIYFCRKR